MVNTDDSSTPYRDSLNNVAIHRSIHAAVQPDKTVMWVCGDCDHPVEEVGSAESREWGVRFTCPRYGHTVAEWRDQNHKETELSMYWDVVKKTKKLTQKQAGRAFPRVLVESEVRYGVHDEKILGRGSDLSESGIGFRGEKLFPVGTKVEIEFRIGSAQAEWIGAKGVVRHIRDRRMGVEFIEVSEVDKLRIRKAVAQIRACGR